MKKNIIKTGLMLVVFVLGLTYVNNANATQEQCHTVQILCGNNSVNLALICGSSYEEYMENYNEMVGVICNPE